MKQAIKSDDHMTFELAMAEAMKAEKIIKQGKCNCH